MTADLHLPSFLWGLAAAPVVLTILLFGLMVLFAFVAEAVERIAHALLRRARP